jgi:hypothetical protein
MRIRKIKNVGSPVSAISYQVQVFGTRSRFKTHTRTRT